MNLRGTVAVAACGLALLGAGAALATGNHGNNEQTTNGSTSSETTTDGKPQGKAYGFYCQNESKKHVAGQKGTPFSQCVTAMAKLGHGNGKSPAKACASMSKKHVAGQKGTPFSQCVSAAAELLKNKH